MIATSSCVIKKYATVQEVSGFINIYEIVNFEVYKFLNVFEFVNGNIYENVNVPL